MICPRCLKESPAEIHTCTPTDFVRGLEQQFAECQREGEEQARLLGMSGSREAKLLAELKQCQRERDELAECLKDAFPHDTHLADGCDCPWCKALAKVGADKGEK